MNDKSAQDKNRWQQLLDWGKDTWKQNKEPIVGGLVGAGLGGGLGAYLGATGPQDPEEKNPVLGPALTGALLGGMGGAALPGGWNALTGGQPDYEKREPRQGLLPRLQQAASKMLRGAGHVAFGSLPALGATVAGVGTSIMGGEKGLPGSPRREWGKAYEQFKLLKALKVELEAAAKLVPSSAVVGAQSSGAAAKLKKLKAYRGGLQRGVVGKGLLGLLYPAVGAGLGAQLAQNLEGQGD